MFKSISWQEFVIALSIAAGCYYALIIIVFYSKDLAARLKGSTVPASPAKKTPSHASQHTFMGSIDSNTPMRKKPVTQSSANADEFEVAETINALAVESPDTTPSDELLQELNNLFEIMKEGKPSQDSYVKNIKTLFAQYTHLIGPQDYTRISLLIIEELKTRHDIFLSTELVEELWKTETVKHSNHSK
jgi:hypothetical protein